MTTMANFVTSDCVTERVRAALARPESYPHRPGLVEVRETHISWVFLADEYAYMLKQWCVRGLMPERESRLAVERQRGRWVERLRADSERC